MHRRLRIVVALLASLPLLAVAAPRAGAEVTFTTLTPKGPYGLGIEADWDSSTRRFGYFHLGSSADIEYPQYGWDCDGIATRADWTLPTAVDRNGSFAWAGSVPEGQTGFGPFELNVHGTINPYARTPSDPEYRYYYRWTARIVQHNGHQASPGGPCAIDSGTQTLTMVCQSGNGEYCPFGTFRPVASLRTRWRKAVASAPMRSHPSKGTATLRIKTPAAGTVRLWGKSVRTAHRSIVKAGKLSIPVVPKGAAAARLRKKGRAAVKVTVSYRPTNGRQVLATRRLTLRRTLKH